MRVTTALLKQLPTKGLEIQQAMTRVKADVIEATNNEQRPWTGIDLAHRVGLVLEYIYINRRPKCVWLAFRPLQHQQNPDCERCLNNATNETHQEKKRYLKKIPPILSFCLIF